MSTESVESVHHDSSHHDSSHHDSSHHTESSSEFFDSEKRNRLENWLVTSLTSRHDLREKLVHLPDDARANLRQLDNEELRKAIADLVVDDLFKNYPKIEKRMQDPEYNDQKYCLHSFTPSQGAIPDKDGVFGIMKIRGTFKTEDEMRDRTTHLIQNVDAFNRYYEGFVGRPFPVTNDERYSLVKDFVDVRNKINEVTAANVKKEREKEKKDVEDLRLRQEKLQEAVDEESADPMTQYLENRVRRSHLIYTVTGGRTTLNNYLNSIKKINAWLEEQDAQHPEYKEGFMERFMDARRQVGVSDNDMTLLQYIGDLEPPGLWDGFVEQEEEVKGVNEELKEQLENATESLRSQEHKVVNTLESVSE